MSLSSAETIVASWDPAGRADNDWILLYPHGDVNLNVIGSMPPALNTCMYYEVTCLCRCLLKI